MHRHLILIISLVLLTASNAHAGWTPPVRISDEGASYAPRTVANADTLHVVYWTSDGLPTYLRSVDSGEFWAEPFCLMDTLTSTVGASPVVRTRGGTVAATWYNGFTSSPRLNIGFRRSTNGGGAWDDVSYVLPTDYYELRKHTFSIGGGILYLVYSRWAQEIIVEFTKSTNWGETWTEPTEVFRTEQTGLFDMVAREDTIHFAWVGRFDYDDEWEIYYIRSTDAGETWSENIMLSVLDDEGSDWPSIAINEEGQLIVCWMDYKYSPNLWRGDLFVRYSYDAGESWTDEEQVTFTHDALYPNVI